MKKILLIEDNADVRENTAEMLELAGYSVQTAPEGKTGVQLAMQDKPDLIICDIMMPILDGYGVLHMLSKHADTAAIPFIFLTAKSERGDFRKGMEMGADDYITKPFDELELLNAVEIRLAKSSRLRSIQAEGMEGLDQIVEEFKKDHPNQKLISEERDVVSYVKKQSIFSEGKHPHYLFYLVSGRVKVYKSNEDGKDLIVGLVGPGEFFGFQALIEDTTYDCTSEVLEDAEVMLIPRKDFEVLLHHDTQVALEFIKLLSRHVIEQQNHLISMAYSSLRKRVANALVQLQEKYQEGEGTFVLQMNRESLANLVGTATESLIRTLSDFKHEKLIDIQNNQIMVLQPEKLRHLLN